MQVTRLSVIEEASFSEGEVATAVDGTEAHSSAPVGLVVRLIMAVYFLWFAPITGGLRIQNTRRYPVRNVLSTLIAGLILSFMSDKTAVISGLLKMPHAQSERIRAILPLVSMLLLLIGRTREVKPELLFTGSVKTELETGNSRQSSAEFVTRYLLVESIASAGLMVFPILDIPGRVKSLVKKLAPTLLTGSETCSACGSSSIVLPRMSMPCKHIFCYYCAKSELTPFNCPRCHKVVLDFIPRNTLLDIHK